MIIPSTLLAKCWDRIRLIAIETMKGAFGNEGALRFFAREERLLPWRGQCLALENVGITSLRSSLPNKILTTLGTQFP